MLKIPCLEPYASPNNGKFSQKTGLQRHTDSSASRPLVASSAEEYEDYMSFGQLRRTHRHSIYNLPVSSRSPLRRLVSTAQARAKPERFQRRRVGVPGRTPTPRTMAFASWRRALGTFVLCAFWAARTSAALFPILASNNTQAAHHACNELKVTLGASIVQSSGPDYDYAASNAWNLENAEYTPTCIVFPSTSADVQTAMNAIFRARSAYAVQAGSHSAMKGWNTVQDGVLIIFSNMQNISYDAVADAITLEPGVHWHDAYVALEPYGVAPVGGRVGDVGTGLLLGGGLSWLSPAHGYACDMFKSLDVVLVNGTLVTATATNQHADLFRALKGAGNRLGIVTRYELYPVHTGTNDVKEWFGGTLGFGGDAEALLNATAKFTREVNDPNAVLLMTFGNAFSGGVNAPQYFLWVFYKGAADVFEDIFSDFLAIPRFYSDLGSRSYLEVAKTLGLADTRGNIQHFGASALIGDEALFNDAFAHWTDFIEAYSEYFESTVLAFTPIPTTQIQAGVARGGNIIAPPTGQFAAVQIYETYDKSVREIPSEVSDALDVLFSQIPPSPGLPLYLNECDPRQNVFASYGNLADLQATYAKYDPFRFNVQYTQGPAGL
ncbi:FAD-binding protein [Mycena kentingensis (nom. inval.)]|nr:FAD-binding protein [Mycena kentingensis (nom. inval.)]